MNPSINILVVEDDNDINQLLCKIINQNGYNAKSAFSGTEAMIYLENQEWDLVLLDLMLSGMTGEEVLGKIAEQNLAPVIIISAKLDRKSKIETLRTGADDYITKPFDIEEVLARIEANLRRHIRQEKLKVKRELNHKDMTLDLDAKTVQVNGTVLSLTAREYMMLVTLVTSPKKVFTKANLFESVWNDRYHGDDNTINVHMSNLRNKLARANPDEEYIETIWGMGYRLKI